MDTPSSCALAAANGGRSRVRAWESFPHETCDLGGGDSPLHPRATRESTRVSRHRPGRRPSTPSGPRLPRVQRHSPTTALTAAGTSPTSDASIPGSTAAPDMMLGGELRIDEVGEGADALEEVLAELVVVDHDVEALLERDDEVHDPEGVELGNRAEQRASRG